MPNSEPLTRDDRATYRGWSIDYDAKPIGHRSFDWTATHPDYDGPGDDRVVHAATEKELWAEIDAFLADDGEGLTQAERETLNAAIDILVRHTPQNATWMPDIRDRGYVSLTYFDSTKGQHSFLPGKTFADKVQAAIDAEAAIPTPEERKARRIANLRAELAAIEGEAA